MDSLAPKFFLAISVVSLFGPEKSISELHTGTTLSNQLGAVGTTPKNIQTAQMTIHRRGVVFFFGDYRTGNPHENQPQPFGDFVPVYLTLLTHQLLKSLLVEVIPRFKT